MFAWHVPFQVLMSVCVPHFAFPFIFDCMVIFLFMNGNHTEELLFHILREAYLDATKLLDALVLL